MCVQAAAMCAQADAALRAVIFRSLNAQIDTLTGAWGAMERINATPLPFAYVVHLRTFLVLYLLAWNLEALALHSCRRLLRRSHTELVSTGESWSQQLEVSASRLSAWSLGSASTWTASCL